MEEGEVGASELVEAAEDTTALFEPSDASLDDVAAAVGSAIEGFFSLILGHAARDHGLDPSALEPVANPLDVVGSVRGEFVGTSSGAASRARQPRGLKRRLEAGAVVSLPGAQDNGQREPATVADQVELCGETASGAS